jgi:hypothetical protein
LAISEKRVQGKSLPIKNSYEFTENNISESSVLLSFSSVIRYDGKNKPENIMP